MYFYKPFALENIGRWAKKLFVSSTLTALALMKIGIPSKFMSTQKLWNTLSDQNVNIFANE